MLTKLRLHLKSLFSAAHTRLSTQDCALLVPAASRMRRIHPNGTGFQMRVRAPSHCTIAKILIETPLAITELHLLKYTATQLENTHFRRLSDTVPQKFTDFSKKVQKKTAFNLAHYRGPLVGISRSGGDAMSSERIKMLNSLMLEVTPAWYRDKSTHLH